MGVPYYNKVCGLNHAILDLAKWTTSLIFFYPDSRGKTAGDFNNKYYYSKKIPRLMGQAPPYYKVCDLNYAILDLAKWMSLNFFYPDSRG